MGVDHNFYIITASKYHKLIRPKLISYFGTVDIKSIIREQERRKESADMLQTIMNPDPYQLSKITSKFLKSLSGQELLMRKFFKSSKSKSFKGNFDSKEYKKIKEILVKHSVFNDYFRSNFFNKDLYLGTIDYFSNGQWKPNLDNFLNYVSPSGDWRVSTEFHVENYLNYISSIRAAMQWANISIEQKVKKDVLSKVQQKSMKDTKTKQDQDDQDDQDERSFDKYNIDEITEFVKDGKQLGGFSQAEIMFQNALDTMKSQKKQMYLLIQSV